MWRDLVAWIFHSPRRLLLVVAVPLIAAAVFQVLASRLGGDDPAPATSDQATGSPRTEGTPSRPRPLAAATPPPEAVAVVTRFVDVWLAAPSDDTDGAVQAWHKRLNAYATPELAAALQETDPSRIPDSTVIGAPKAVSVGDYLTEMSVPMSDGRDLALTIAWDGDAWRVSDIERESTP